MFRSLLKIGSGKISVGNLLLGSSISAGFIFAIGANQSVQANSKSIVAVEPLTCDLVSAIALPSTPVTCLINRKQY